MRGIEIDEERTSKAIRLTWATRSPCVNAQLRRFFTAGAPP
jgi:hypothetical protein